MLIAIFSVAFLQIHPFQDGNGRLSRILTNLMLMRADYTWRWARSLVFVGMIESEFEWDIDRSNNRATRCAGEILASDRLCAKYQRGGSSNRACCGG